MSFVPLTQAVTSGDAGAVKAVLATGADVNERTGGGQTALILATIFGHTHLIPLLLDAGADPQLRDNLGLNAIDWAHRRGATEALEVLSNKPSRTPIASTTARPQTPSIRSATTIDSGAERSFAVSDEERSRRWIAGLKQRIAEQAQSDVPDAPNIFRPQSVELQHDSQPWLASTEREPQAEIPVEPSTPQPELPATPPEPEPEIPAPPPDPQHDLPAEPRQPEPESPTEPSGTEIETRTFTQELARISTEELARADTQEPALAAAQELPRRSGRRRCPKCNAVYSDLISYCAHHIVPLVDFDGPEPPPVISQPHSTSPVLFWMIIVVTLIASLVAGSYIAGLFKTPAPVQPTVTAAPPAARAVQKGTPVVGKELEGKVRSLPNAEAPLNGQEAIPGTVVVRVTVNRTGQVIKAQASGADWLLRGAASEAAMKSIFAPEKLTRRTTEGTITYTFEP